MKHYPVAKYYDELLDDRELFSGLCTMESDRTTVFIFVIVLLAAVASYVAWITAASAAWIL